MVNDCVRVTIMLNEFNKSVPPSELQDLIGSAWKVVGRFQAVKHLELDPAFISSQTIYISKGTIVTLIELKPMYSLTKCTFLINGKTYNHYDDSVKGVQFEGLERIC